MPVKDRELNVGNVDRNWMVRVPLMVLFKWQVYVPGFFFDFLGVELLP